MLAALFATFLMALAPARPAQCVDLGGVGQVFDHADVVFLGTATTVERTGVGGVHVVASNATFRVERVWKGPTQGEFTVGVSDPPFAVGERYIVFASGKPLTTTIECGWAELESKAHIKRKFLESKPSRRPQ
jgi:hypothetical protein